MNCKECGKVLSRGNKSGFCQKCLIQNNRDLKIQHWLETGDTGFTVDTTIRGPIREYILNAQDKKCAICGISNIWNNQELNFVLDHINGDASNSSKENLRLICPNCDSQLPTFKSRNKNSARTKRKEFIHENIIRLNDE